MQPAAFRFQAFLCYSHRDSAWADWLHRALESYPIPSRLVGLTTSAGVIPARLAPVFRDRDELPSATDLSGKVTDALAQSACLVVICSPHSAQSHWVNEEVEAFQRLGRANRIFCLIVDGEPGASAWAGREHDECLPAALMHRIDASGNATTEILEPIAADVRPGKDGRSNARTKLVAGILGVDLDDLRHRERRRRRWRLAAGIAASFAVLCLTTALAVNAVIARHAAERRQKQAEDLVGFMLGDLDDKLRQVNRLDILESIADKSVKYFASLPLADMTDESLAQHAKALQKIGRVRQDQSRMPEADSAFKAAQETSGELVRRAPTRSDFATLDAENLQWLGRVSWARGDLAGALARFTAAGADLDRLSSSQLDEGAVADLSGSVRTNIGRVYEARGDLDAARAEYAVVLRTYERLSAREPDRLNWKAEVGYAHNNLGQLAWKDGHLDVAIREYAADRLIKASLAALEPNNNARREDLLISNAILGNALVAVGETAAAGTYLRAAVADAEKLVASDSTVSAWQDDAGYYGMRLATWARLQGDLPTAARHGDRSLVTLRKLVDQDPANVSWTRELAEAEIEAARRLLLQGRTDSASEVIRSAIARIGALLEKNGDDRTFALVHARARITAGDIASAAHDDAAAGHEWKLAAFATETAVKAAADPSWLDAQASVLIRLGDVAGAESLLIRLAAMGYRHPDLMSAANAAGTALSPDPDVARRIEAAMATLQGGSETASSEPSTRPPT